MKILYTLEQNEAKNSIFLAGPTYRNPNRISWRKEAVKLLKAQKYKGIVCYPEWENKTQPINWSYKQQIDWESKYLSKAKVILFWIPRNMKDLPGLTTNIEFGEWMKSGKIVVGAPTDAEHIKYIYEKCLQHKIPWATTLKDCVNNALDKINTQGTTLAEIFEQEDALKTLKASKKYQQELHNFKQRFEKATLKANWNERKRKRLLAECLRRIDERCPVDIIPYFSGNKPYIWNVMNKPIITNSVKGHRKRFVLSRFKTKEKAEQFAKNLGLKFVEHSYDVSKAVDIL